jgi:hypothetical protein
VVVRNVDGGKMKYWAVLSPPTDATAVEYIVQRARPAAPASARLTSVYSPNTSRTRSWSIVTRLPTFWPNHEEPIIALHEHKIEDDRLGKLAPVGIDARPIEAGVLRHDPRCAHQWVERIVGPLIIILALIAMTETPARAFFVAMGVIIFAVERLTAYRPMAAAK